jgi:hypothetical protein
MSLSVKYSKKLKMKKELLTVITGIILFPSFLSGQIVIQQAGFRLGYNSGIFYQMGSEAGNAEIAYNAMLSFRKNGLQFTGLKIVYETTFSGISPDLIFGWGYGGHLGFIYSDHVKFRGEDYYFYGERFSPLLGIDGFFTAEYRIHEIPVNVSLNVKPFVEFTAPSFVRIVPWDFAVSIAYVF